jgi:hypothetical protein
MIAGVTNDLEWVVILTTDDRLYQMSHSAKIVSAIFYEHALIGRHFGSKCNPRHET